MCNGSGAIDNGCIALLIDELATFLYALHGKLIFSLPVGALLLPW